MFSKSIIWKNKLLIINHVTLQPTSLFLACSQHQVTRHQKPYLQGHPLLLPTLGPPPHVTGADLLALAGCVFNKALLSPRQSQAAPLALKAEISDPALQFLFSSPRCSEPSTRFALSVLCNLSHPQEPLKEAKNKLVLKNLWHYSGHFRINFIPPNYLRISIISPHHHQCPYSINQNRKLQPCSTTDAEVVKRSGNFHH